MTKTILISEIKENPNNPRIISKESFKKLLKSLKEFPSMLKIRPLVLDENNVVLGGNMRLKALKELGVKEISVVFAKDWTEEQKKEFIIKDNIGFGDWNWADLEENWDFDELTDWGLNCGFDNTNGEEDEKTLEDTKELEVVVEMENEQEQEELFNELMERGYKVKTRNF